MKTKVKQTKLQAKIRAGSKNHSQPANQPQKLSQMTTIQHHQAIATYAEKLLVEPQKNIASLVPLLALTKSSNIKTCILALDTLSNIFTSVSPLQSINIDDHKKQLSHQLKKEEFATVNFQVKLVEGYKKYIDLLKQLTNKLKPQFFQKRQIFLEFKKAIMRNLIKCVKILWNFNYNRELLQVFIKYIKNQQVQQAIQNLLQDGNPSLMSFKVGIIKALTQLIVKKDEKTLPSNLVQIINLVQIDTNYLKKNQDTQKYKSKLKKKREYRDKEIQRKNNKQKDPLEWKQQRKQKRKQQRQAIKKQVDKQFEQGEQNIKKKILVKQNTDVLQELFYLYFKILTRKSISVYLKDSLDGVLKFCHLITTQLLQSLITNLNQSAQIFIKQWQQTKNMKYLESSFYVIFSSQSVINGPASIFQMQDLNQVSNFYKLLKALNKSYKIRWTKQMFKMSIKILYEMFIKKRQLSNEIVGSFVRQIFILMNTQLVPIHSFLEVIRQLAFKYHKIHKMFQEDNQGYGINSYNPQVIDPQSTNAIYTSVTDYLNQLKKKTPKLTKEELTIVNGLLKQNFQSQVPKELALIAQEEEWLIQQ